MSMTGQELEAAASNEKCIGLCASKLQRWCCKTFIDKDVHLSYDIDCSWLTVPYLLLQ